ncbi:PAS domain-containing protein [Microvirga solisilvae]|uniref:PAS domain-containing protein n=1 Tax=Microvirga solisilvae TaxID=2919498 RepID=UPI001FAE816F|nr:PAS domain-containing protein [Microvirga solisilvae]
MSFLQGGGEMGERMRAYDWSTSPLGCPETWPQPLRTLVALMLGSQQPMFVAWGPERVMLYNNGYAPMCGQRHPAALGKSFADVWYDILDTIGPILDRAYAGEPIQMDDITYVMHRNGYPEETHFAFSYTPVRDESGQVAGMFCACTETTQQVLAQRALVRTQERLSHALSASGMIGTWDWHIPTDTFYSDARFAVMFSVDPDKAEAGAHLADYLAGIHPEDVGRIEKAIDHAIATGEKYTQQYRLLHKDGTIRWVEAQGQCLYDETGKPLRFPGAAVDITKAKQADLAIRESEARFRNLADNAPVMIWVTEPDGTCTYLSRSWYEFTGQVPEKALGFGWLDAVHPEDREWSGDVFLKANAKREAFQLEYRLRRHDGTYRWSIDAAAPRFSEDGAFLGYVGSVIDITHRKAAEQFQSLLLHELNHRVKNLFSVTGSLVAMSARSAKDPQELARTLEGQISAMARANDLILPDRGEDTEQGNNQELRGTTLSDLLQAVLRPYLERLEASPIFLEGPTVPIGESAVTSLALVFYESAANAMKYGALSNSSGQVRISWAIRNDNLDLRWEEKGGPTIAEPPTRRGFGSRLVERSIKNQFYGTIEYQWLREGLVMQMTVPMEHLVR